MNNMHHQPEEPIDEILPRVRLASQAPLQELPINVRKRHAATFRAARRASGLSAQYLRAKLRNLPYFTFALHARQAQRRFLAGLTLRLLAAAAVFEDSPVRQNLAFSLAKARIPAA
jgi:hypothetical protein